MTRTARIFCGLAALLILQGAAATASLARTQLAQAASGAPDATEAVYVSGVQKELLAHGYQPGPVDGIAGPQTRAAVSAYQRDAGLTVDGKADKRLLDHLKFALPKIYTFGAPVTGHILDLQRELAKRDYYLGPHDGLAGPAIYRALDRFQRDAKMPPNTEIGSNLVQQIREAPAEIKADLAN
ncbi:MAG: peptidoglycan-binding protein [Kiloniellaceae bacterium]